MVCQGGIAFAPKTGAEPRNQQIKGTIILALLPTIAATVVGHQANKTTVGTMPKVSPSKSELLFKTGSNMLVSKFWFGSIFWPDCPTQQVFNKIVGRTLQKIALCLVTVSVMKGIEEFLQDHVTVYLCEVA
jgi:hypothetical protein